MPSTLRRIDDPHAAPIAPDIIPADWADGVPHPANDAQSREKLFAEIRHAAETAAPEVDTTFRASDVSDNPALKSRARLRGWLKRAFAAFAFALISVFAAAYWERHGDAAKQALANWVPLATSTSTATEWAAEPSSQPAEQQAVAPVPAEPAVPAATLPPEAEQQIRSMARDLAAMGQEIEQLKATIEAMKANQQAAVTPAAPAVRVAAPAKPRATAPAPRPAPRQSHSGYPPVLQTATAPAPPVAAPPPQTPVQASSPPQASTQPNGEPVMRPPMPLSLSDRY